MLSAQFTRRGSPVHPFAARQIFFDSDPTSPDRKRLSDQSSDDHGGDSEDEWRASTLSRSFWDEEVVPSYPIDRRQSVIPMPSSLLDKSMAAIQVNELRKESEDHLSRVVGSLLQADPLLAEQIDVWLPLVCQLSTKAASKVVLRSPDVMDVTEYVRVTIATGGLPSDSHYVRGVVLKNKTVMHTSMRSHMQNPRILLMGCAVQFSRPDWRFVEFDVLQAQERDFLRILVDRIAALKPDLLVTSDSISSLALDFLMDAGITCVSRVHPLALERLARFSGATIMRNLSDFHSVVLGQDCGVLKAFCPVTLTGVRNFLYFQDCPAACGGTIVVRGADTQILHALKNVFKFAVSTAYHLRLEDAFISDLCLHSVSTRKVEPSDVSASSSPRTLPVVSMSPSVAFAPPLSGGLPVPVGFRMDRSVPDLLLVHTMPNLLSVNFEYEDVLRGMNEHGDNAVAASAAQSKSILDNQSITYCFSQHHSEKQSHCVTYQYHHIPFYSKMDMPLSSFLRWSCLMNPCSVQACSQPLCEHESSFLYGNKRMFVSSSPSADSSSSAEVLAWFSCNECVESSQPRTLSHDALELSLGKLLELLFLDRSLSCSVGHQLNPNGTLVFSSGGRLISFSFMRTSVYRVEPPARQMRSNPGLEASLVEKELSALAAAAHVSYAVIKKRVSASEADTLAREEGDFLQSVNDAKRFRLLQVNQLFRVLLTNVMRWQGSLEASAASASMSDLPDATPSTRRLLGMSVSTGVSEHATASAASSLQGHSSGNSSLSTSASGIVLPITSTAGVAGGASVSGVAAPALPPSSVSGSSTAALVESLLPEKPDAPLLARLIKKPSPQVPQLQHEIVEAMATSLSKENCMYQLFSGRGAPMPLSSLTGEVVMVLDAEPSSHIACALGADQYREQMHDILGPLVAAASESGSVRSVVDLESMSFEKLRRFALTGSSSSSVLPNSIKVAFECMLPRLPYVCDVTIYYPVQFAALRKLYCGGETAFVYSMARSQSWAAKEEGGGASKVFSHFAFFFSFSKQVFQARFVNTLDGQFLLKSVPSVELRNFQAFAHKVNQERSGVWGILLFDFLFFPRSILSI